MTKLVYSLRNYFEKYPEKMNGAGTRKIHGGVGSQKWWDAVSSGKIRSFEETGIIRELILEGHENENSPPNVALVENNEGEFWKLGLQVDKPEYHKHFLIGSRVREVSIRIQLKNFRIPFILRDYVDITSEIWIFKSPRSLN